MMLNGAGDEFGLFRIEGSGRALDGPVIALSTTGGKDDLVGHGVDALRDYAPGILDSMPGLLCACMEGRGLAKPSRMKGSMASSASGSS